MRYGEDLTSNASSGVNHAVLGGVGEAKSLSGGSAPSAPSIARASELAVVAQKMGAERTAAVEHLAGRATSIATRFAGSYPFGAPTRDPHTDGERPEPRSALDALLREVAGIRDPLSRMDPALQELSAALDVIERSIG